MNNTAIKIVGMNGLPALKEQSGDLGIAFSTLKYLAPYHFYAKQDHYAAQKFRSSDYLLKKPRRYFLSKKEQEELKTQILKQNLLYRNIAEETETETRTTDNKQNTFSDQKEIKSSDNYKPKFQL